MSKLSPRKKLLTVILSPVIFLLMLEVVLRLADYTYDPVAEGSTSTPHIAWKDIDNYQQDPELLWTMKRDARLDDISLGFIRVRTNSAGLRGDPLPGRKEPGEIRIVCLGDSILFGLALPEEASVPAQLQRYLAFGPLDREHHVRVISVAVPGWSSLQGVRMLDRLQDLEPDLVVFWFGMNDAQPARILPDERLGPSDEHLIHTTNLLRSLRSFQLVQRLIHLAMGGIETPRRVSPELFGSIVADLESRAGKGGPEMLFVRCPNLLDLAIAQKREVLERAEQEGVKKVYGPFRLMTALNAARPGTDLQGRQDKEAAEGGQSVLIFEGGEVVMFAEVEKLRENLAFLEGMRKALRLDLATLPADALTPEQVFGGPPKWEYFIDICHLSALGAQRAGKSLARIIEQRLGK